MQEHSAIATLTSAPSVTSICKGIALRGEDYCRYHITLHKPTYTPRIDNSDEIRTLTTLLNKLINKSGAYEDSNTLRVIALLRKDIDTRKAQRNTLTAERLNALVMRIYDVITLYASDKRNEIRTKLIDVIKEYGSDGLGE